MKTNSQPSPATTTTNHRSSPAATFSILYLPFAILTVAPSALRSLSPFRVFSVFRGLPVGARFNALTLLTLLTIASSACTAPRPLRGGRAVTSGPVQQSLIQSDNPSQSTKQDQETIRTRTYTLPAGTKIEQVSPNAVPIPSHSSHSAAAPSPSTINYQLSTPLTVTEREETRARTELGAAQKDTARELGAKLSSLKGIVWVGVGLFVFGLTSLFWPPLRAIIGSLTTSIAITLGGIALMVLPTLIVGNELLILAGVALAVGAWFLAHRHGHLRGQLSAAPRPPHKSSSSSSSSS